MTLNPIRTEIMQFLQDFRAATFAFEAMLELPEKLKKLAMRVLVILVRRTPMFDHAAFFVLEMHVGISLNKIHEV